MVFFRIAYNKAVHSNSLILPNDFDSNFLCIFLELTNGNIKFTVDSAYRDYVKIGEF